MSFLDKLAEDNSHIIKLDKVASIDDELRSILFRTFEPFEKVANSANCQKALGIKTAYYSSTFGRIDQTADIDMHQDDETPDVWIQKQDKLIRII